MTVVQFLTATGALTWMWLAWRAYQFTRGMRYRLSWALWKHKQPKRVWR